MVELTRRQILMMFAANMATNSRILADELRIVAPQPYFANVDRAISVLAKLGAPVALADAENISLLVKRGDTAAVVVAEDILSRYTLAHALIESDGYACTAVGAARRMLLEQGWQLFLVRIANPMALSGKLKVAAGRWPIESTASTPSTGAARAGVLDTLNSAPLMEERWLVAHLYNEAPMRPELSGFGIEYRVIQLYSRDRGQRRIEFNFYTADEPYASFLASAVKRRGATLSFDCVPSKDVVLRIRDVDGAGCVASLTFRDKLDRIYPLPAMRLAPDMPFHPHIYRADGETVRLPDGDYRLESRRGPEYLLNVQFVSVGDGTSEIEIQLRRWVDPSKWGWYSGDPHIHAAGCAHYEHPTEGVAPETMIRHVRGEALSIGNVLSWGPGWYYQKRFFSGHAESPAAELEVPALQLANNSSLQPRSTPKDGESLLRYDVEISGFPSSHCGHLALLRLKEQDYPGTKVIEDWPSWNLPILRWAKAQGAVVGYTHCGMGMVSNSDELPNYEIPPMDGIGTQEAIVDVTYGCVDFLSGCSTQPTAELNAWYHMLNCGFRLSFAGETDYPCIGDERPGIGRTYVRLAERPLNDAGYHDWMRGMKEGRLYCGDGRSHFLDFKINGLRTGEGDLQLADAGTVTVEALVAALLEAKPLQSVERRIGWNGLSLVNGWHLEFARVGASCEVPVDLIVNGFVVDSVRVVADGKPRSIRFQLPIGKSSWVALRILPSAHTYPMFVLVNQRAIRASRRSADWCRTCVDKLWEAKSPLMRADERPAASAAFEEAGRTYERIASECEDG